MKISHLHVANFDLNYVRWHSVQHDPVRKVRVFGDDGEIMLFGVCPNLAIQPCVAQVKDVQVIRSLPKRKVIREVSVDEVLGSARPCA
jgi:hypothetical protein